MGYKALNLHLFGGTNSKKFPPHLCAPGEMCLKGRGYQNTQYIPLELRLIYYYEKLAKSNSRTKGRQSLSKRLLLFRLDSKLEGRGQIFMCMINVNCTVYAFTLTIWFRFDFLTSEIQTNIVFRIKFFLLCGSRITGSKITADPTG